MSAIDAKGTTFTIDGTPVGGIVSYEFMQGQTPPIVFKAINAPATIAVPGLPDHGTCHLKLYRDTSDAGQQKLLASLQFRLVAECVLTYATGATMTFKAFCTSLPSAGSVTPDQPAVASSCVLRITGPIT